MNFTSLLGSSALLLLVACGGATSTETPAAAGSESQASAQQPSTFHAIAHYDTNQYGTRLSISVGDEAVDCTAPFPSGSVYVGIGLKGDDVTPGTFSLDTAPAARLTSAGQGDAVTSVEMTKGGTLLLSRSYASTDALDSARVEGDFTLDLFDGTTSSAHFVAKACPATSGFVPAPGGR